MFFACVIRSFTLRVTAAVYSSSIDCPICFILYLDITSSNDVNIYFIFRMYVCTIHTYIHRCVWAYKDTKHTCMHKSMFTHIHVGKHVCYCFYRSICFDLGMLAYAHVHGYTCKAPFCMCTYCTRNSVTFYIFPQWL